MQSLPTPQGQSYTGRKANFVSTGAKIKIKIKMKLKDPYKLRFEK